MSIHPPPRRIESADRSLGPCAHVVDPVDRRVISNRLTRKNIALEDHLDHFGQDDLLRKIAHAADKYARGLRHVFEHQARWHHRLRGSIGAFCEVAKC